MSTNTITAVLPTGRKVELQPYQAGKKSGHALLNPETGRYHGFGVAAPAAAKTLPSFLTIDGARVDLTSDKSVAGNPRVKAQNVVITEGRRAVVRLVDLGEGEWNYLIEVAPPAKGKGSNNRTSKALFS